MKRLNYDPLYRNVWIIFPAKTEICLYSSFYGKKPLICEAWVDRWSSRAAGSLLGTLIFVCINLFEYVFEVSKE